MKEINNENITMDSALEKVLSVFDNKNTDRPFLWRLAGIAQKAEMLNDIASALCIVDSYTFVGIRDSIEMEYDRRIRDGEMSDAFYQSIVGHNNIQISAKGNVKINNDSVDMGDSNE